MAELLRRFTLGLDRPARTARSRLRATAFEEEEAAAARAVCAASPARRAAARRATRATRCGRSPNPISWFRTRRACAGVRLPLDPKAPIAIEKRQVFDLPERLLLVERRHQASTYRCANCRGVTKVSAFPEGVVSPVDAIWRALQGVRGGSRLNVGQQLIPEAHRTGADDERYIRRASGLFGERRRLGGQRRRKTSLARRSTSGSASASTACREGSPS